MNKHFFIFISLQIFMGVTLAQNHKPVKRDSIVDKLLKENKLFSQNKEYQKAITVVNKIESHAKEQKDTALWVKTFHLKGYYYNKLNQPFKALKYYDKGILLAEQSLNDKAFAQLTVGKSVILNKFGDFKEAQISAIKGIETAKNINDTTTITKLYNILASSSSNNMEYKIAEEAYHNALIFATKSKQILGLKNNLAVNFKDQNQYNKAAAIYKELLKDTTLSQFPELESRVQSNLGFALLKMNDTLKAKSFLENALKTRLENKDWSGVFASYIHFVNYHKSTNKKAATTYARMAFNTATLKTKSPASQREALKHLLALKTANETEMSRFTVLDDSLNAARQKKINEYAAVKFRTKELDAENQQLEIAKKQQEIISAEETQKKWLFAFGLATATLIALFLYRRYISEKRSKEIITSQKNEIESQKNLVVNLQKELHHRLKNNLAFIDVFISLAKGKFKNEEYQDKLTELQNRIKSMFEIHEQLFQNENITSANAAAYVSKLVANVSDAYATQDVTIQKDIDEQLSLNSQTLFPVGIIINEFVTNSYKYAFSPEVSGKIIVQLKETTDHYVLELSDNGIGLPKDFNLQSISTFGLDSIKLLTQEYDGNFKINSDNGVNLKITLPKNLIL